MAFSVRNANVETKARRLATARGTTMTGALLIALDNELKHDDEVERRQKLLALVRKAQAEMAALPDSGLSDDEIMGWDENGLPT